MVPIPIKGDLTKCDNWRGIALLDVVGKVVGRLIQDRLQQLAANELPESQCGFRRGRSCTDQIFTTLQIIEKVYEHRSASFIIFIDLWKAYDSVPQEALWKALGLLGVSPTLVRVILPHFMIICLPRCESATRTLTRFLSTMAGLRQGCSISPVLFNLYFSPVFEVWCAKMAEACTGESFCCRFNINGNLFNSPRTRSSMGNVLDLEFADDAALVLP